ncbi:hypothetical protein [Streptomyces gobiensis]|uniref:hypothetical protein n=1 Tax=Streptomyces gobiensis TaxID=2875706 RepID=UPI001E295480|nr:hypothetical protein [Streptomyces gobiensis]UGY93581.1 hypothetical protein test1122_18895 [Streptomyces gobiensis]
MSADKYLCGARRPKWQETSPLVASRLPCVLEEGHGEAHQDAMGQTWMVTTPELVFALGVLFASEELRRLLGGEGAL